MKKPNRITIGYDSTKMSVADRARCINMMALLGYYYDGMDRITDDNITMIKFTDVPNEAQS